MRLEFEYILDASVAIAVGYDLREGEVVPLHRKAVLIGYVGL